MGYSPSHSYASLPPDQRTFQILKDISNSIDRNIQMEFDVPSLHSSNRVPVLDLEVWVDVENKIQHSFYSKPISSPYTILYRSAVPAQVKRNSLLQEGLRRIRNYSESVTDQERNEILSKFMNSLRISGYNTKYRYELLNGILNRVEQVEK